MVRGRSGREVVKRIMRVRGGIEGGGGAEVMVVCLVDAVWVVRSYNSSRSASEFRCSMLMHHLRQEIRRPDPARTSASAIIKYRCHV